MKIKVIVDRFEENISILKTEDGQTINWPKNNLPEDTKEGSVLNFIITDDPKSEDEKKELAKNILNELISIDEE